MMQINVEEKMKQILAEEKMKWNDVEGKMKYWKMQIEKLTKKLRNNR